MSRSRLSKGSAGSRGPEGWEVSRFRSRNTAYLVIGSILLAGPILEIGGKEDFNFSATIAGKDIEKLNGAMEIFESFWKV